MATPLEDRCGRGVTKALQMGACLECCWCFVTPPAFGQVSLSGEECGVRVLGLGGHGGGGCRWVRFLRGGFGRR